MQPSDNPLPKAVGRLQVLDGWRAMSILAVLAAHLLPLGPHAWHLNAAAGELGMAIFFTLSGFLITSFLLHHANVVDFLIRRFCRIVPLSWLALPFGLWMAHATVEQYVANFLFYANLPPFWLTDVTAHFWSLCVEMQFYTGVALMYALLGRRALLLLPIGCIAVTALRMHAGAYTSIVTYYRIDEILAGATLALAYNGELRWLAPTALGRVSLCLVLPLLLASAHDASGFLNYFRPYFAAMVVGATLTQPASRASSLLRNRVLAYIAEISYALYIVHPILGSTWLGSGPRLVKYAKRPLLLVAIFALAHASTFYYEHRWIAFGKRFSAKLMARGRADTASPQA